MRVLLGVGGGIAAYKSVVLLRLLTERGHEVRVVPTRAALRFVGAPTFEALSGQPVTTEVFDDVPGVAHVALGRDADLVVVAPATADLIARAAAGRADDLLTATLLTARCPVVMAPAMHTEMWQHPATVRNVERLRGDGVVLVGPDSGRLTGADSGPGRMAEPDQIAEVALATVHGGGREPVAADLSGLTVVISAGGTREPIDPVRFLGNRSSGRQGVALALAARDRGADVVLVAAHLDAGAQGEVREDARMRVEQVGTAAQMREAVRKHARGADVVVMAAAVADFRPAQGQTTKIKKNGEPPAAIQLVENPDILAELAHDRLRQGQTIVGFAAETGDMSGSVLDHGRAKALRKGADLMVVNAVGEGKGFAAATNDVTILDALGVPVGQVRGSKRVVADGVWDAVRVHRDRAQ